MPEVPPLFLSHSEVVPAISPLSKVGSWNENNIKLNIQRTSYLFKISHKLRGLEQVTASLILNVSSVTSRNGTL